MSCDYDFEYPEFYNSKIVTARKIHFCTECGYKIKEGQKYENASGKWDGRISTFKTCNFCLDSREKAMNITGCHQVMHGALWENINDAVNEITFKAGDKFSLMRLVIEKRNRKER